VKGETIRLILHWQGGDHTQVEFEKIRTGRHRFVTSDAWWRLFACWRGSNQTRGSPPILNRNQRRTAHGEIWTAKRICSLRHNHRDSGVPGRRAASSAAKMSVSENRCCVRRYPNHNFASDSAKAVAGDTGLCRRTMDSTQGGRRAMLGPPNTNTQRPHQ